ncbi:MAG: N-acetylmuramic acid 6-phosphate etherase [Terracidiphilus sp.]|jgi:N-acetylmuramic acid 6-phosphate etherase
MLSGLETERQNRASSDLDKMNALEIATLMNRQDARVLRAVRQALPSIAQAIDVVRDRLAAGGRLIYVGTGTSGRIGALDASECPPTFGTDPDMIQYVIAGGEQALANASEASEDSSQLGTRDMAARKPGKKDVVVGLAASGRTPYTVAALKYAARKGAATIAIICNTGSELAGVAEIAIEAEVGPEILTGSTRLKAGTAQKLICNMLTTGAMARLGYVYGNLMVNLHLKNEKLLERGISIVRHVAKVNRSVALATLEAADMKVSVALVMLCAQVAKPEAIRRLKRAQGSIRRAIEA